jgi:predicted amidohydrolase
MRVAAIQMVSAIGLEANLARARALLAQAAAEGAELAVLPEYFCVMGAHDADKVALRETPGKGPVQDVLAAAARELGLWVVGGTLPLATAVDERRVFNTSLAFSPAGECVARYDKVHLFRFDNGREQYDESRSVTPGAAPVVCVKALGTSSRSAPWRESAR